MANRISRDRGSFLGKRGNQFERHLVEILNESKNLVDFKKGNLKNENIYTLILNRLLADNDIVLKNIDSVSATNTVPKLLNKGNSKTDIIITLQVKSKVHTETISLKKTDQKVVSCHEYTAIDFIRVLKCEKTKLADYLFLFQEFPSYKAIEKNFKKGYSIEGFSRLLSKQTKVLSEWALRGMHDTHNLVNPELQISNYLLIQSDKLVKTAFYSMDQYITMITEQKIGRLGVPFSWTYPSKRRGKRIQLKVPILFE